MPKVFRLGYITLDTPHLESAKRYYTEVLGATEVAVGEDGTSYLSLGLDHHNIALRPAAAPRLADLGFQIDPAIDIADLARQIQQHGLSADIKSDPRPGIRRLIEVKAPGDSIVQLYDAIDMPAPGFKPTGIGAIRLGHVAVISPEADKLVKFYGEVLGFWTTDWVADVATFMTCNRDHHVMNIVGAPLSKVHHVAYELPGAISHNIAGDLLRRAAMPVVWGPSRHTAGHNLASYHYGPDQVLIELYAELDVFIPELGFCEPRPWHEVLPMRPKRWDPQVSAWNTGFAFDFARA
jgi:catechol-2,3-dioxygenase